jgi:hypothetical protein
MNDYNKYLFYKQKTLEKSRFFYIDIYIKEFINEKITLLLLMLALLIFSQLKIKTSNGLKLIMVT